MILISVVETFLHLMDTANINRVKFNRKERFRITGMAMENDQEKLTQIYLLQPNMCVSQHKLP